jgi:hypothetical protein
MVRRILKKSYGLPKNTRIDFFVLGLYIPESAAQDALKKPSYG